MRVAFVDQHKGEHGIEPICEALAGTPDQIAPSTYYAATSRPASARSVSDAATLEQIRSVHSRNFSAYGTRKTWIALRRNDYHVARCTVERLMRANGIHGLRKGKTPRTTVPAKTGHPADLVGRAFTADRPNQLWVADITYIRTCAGWVYAAFVMDMHSRRIVGWQATTSLHTTLALDALEMGIWAARRAGHDLAGLIHHSDRGVQYRAVRYSERLAEEDLVASVGSKGDSYDNAAAEAFNSTFKTELIRNPVVLLDNGPWKGIDDVEIAIAEWVDWYNTTRLHGSLGDIPPVEYEALYYAQLQPSQTVGATP